MAEDYRRLTVFLASPGDLHTERKAAKEAIDSLNGILGRQLSWHVELRGWEDTLPGFGRPQELINKDVDACNLFVGLLWRRWGSATGEFSSGFEEEFERARKRRTETKSPEMWLLFKKIDEVQLADPGDQLKQVMAFRQKQIASRELLFKEFVDVDDWRKQFYDCLLEYILSLSKPQPEISGTSPASTPSSGSAESITSEISNSSGDAANALASQQILRVIGQVNEVVRAGNVDALPNVSEKLDEFAIHRLNLIAATLSSTIYTKDFLGTHEINTLYRYRSDLKIANWEDVLLFRTIVKDYQTHVCPGWYWFQNMNEGRLGAWLFHVVSEDSNETVRQRALEILEETSIRPTLSSKREEVRSALLQDPSENIRKAFLKYLKAVGDVEDVPAIISAASDKDSGVREQAVRARIIVAARINQNDAFSVLLGSTEGISKDLLDEFGHLGSDVKDELLVEALQSNVDRVRAFALNELQRRNQLTKEIALKMREDTSPEVRAICYRVLIEEGSLIEPSDVRKAFIGVSSRHGLLGLGSLRADTVDPDELVLDVCRKLSLDQLIQRSDWYEIDGYLVYKAIALAHFSTEGDRIRSDLKDRFMSYKEKTDNSYRAKYGSAGDSFVSSYEEKDLNSFLKSRFTAAALAGLAENAGSEDISIARDYLADSNDNVVLEAVRIVERFGDSSDVGALLNLAKGKYGKLQGSSAIAALKLSPGPEGAARALLDTGSPTLVGIVVKFLRDSPAEETAELLEPLLSHKDDNVRLKALAFLGGKLSIEQLEELLKRYVSSGSFYYYNVVCWLDRILYGPSSLRDIFSQQLQAKLD